MSRWAVMRPPARKVSPSSNFSRTSPIEPDVAKALPNGSTPFLRSASSFSRRSAINSFSGSMGRATERWVQLFRKEFARCGGQSESAKWQSSSDFIGLLSKARRDIPGSKSVGDAASVPCEGRRLLPLQLLDPPYGTRSSQNDIETRRTTRKAVFRFPFEQGRRHARRLEIAERSLLSRDCPKCFGIDRFGDRAFGGERSRRRRRVIPAKQCRVRDLPCRSRGDA